MGDNTTILISDTNLQNHLKQILKIVLLKVLIIFENLNKIISINRRT